MKYITLLVVLIFTFSNFVSIVYSKNDDCVYNKCDFKLNPNDYTKHVPCLDTNGRSLVRDVDCTDGNTYHICCKMPIREDIQKSRQKWFRAVTWAGQSISHNCTTRILCEQSCKDGLDGDARSDYPQVLEDDSEVTRQYVRAYKDGENQACYGQTIDRQKQDQKDGFKSCEGECKQKYPDCEQEMDKSYLCRAYYQVARTFHKMGIWVFSSTWLVHDHLVSAMQTAVEIGTAVKEAFTKLYDRMTSLDRAFQQWKTTNGSISSGGGTSGRKRRSSEGDNETESLWNRFLLFYNATDSALVEQVYESLNYEQFSKIVQTINETLATHDFGGNKNSDTN